MPLLIDTNIAIHVRDNDRIIIDTLVLRGERPVISLVTLIELEGGTFADPSRADERRTGLASLLRQVTVQPIDRIVVEEYGAIVRRTGFSRRKILDRLIAATALVHDLTLVTINGEDFRDIPDLRIEVWPSPQ